MPRIPSARCRRAISARLGGNLVTAVPSMDSGPTLMALEAEVNIVAPAGRRQVPLSEFLLGPRKTVLKPDELLAEIIIPKRNLAKPTPFLEIRVAQRTGAGAGERGVELLVSIGTRTRSWRRGSRSARWRPKVIRAPQAEAYLEGRTITPEAMAEAGRVAVNDAKPISDFRASADYRRNLVAVLTKRTLEGAYALAQAKQ